jgi:isoquinoline 1-oxidoreductase subunit beta
MADSERAGLELGRRGFLKGAAASGLVLSVQWSWAAEQAAALPAADGGGLFAPNAFVQVTPDNWVVVIVKHLEMGQGTTTGFASLVAEELDADWAHVRAEYAPSDPTRYNNLAWGPVQGTGGSTAIRAGYEQMRRAGATARAMLVQAAAQSWRVPASEIAVANSTLTHKSGKRASFGELALAAAKLPVPKDVKLKDPAKFVLIGKEGTRRLDSLAKCTGTALYTSDVKLPGLLNAFVVRPPAFGARLRKFDASAAKALPGVTDVVQIPEGVAVVATSTWAALRGCDALKVDWDNSEAAQLSSEALFTQYRALAQKSGTPVTHSEQSAPALAQAAKTIDAVYEFPFLAHAALEPMNCVVWLHDGQLETWAGHQSQTGDQRLAAEAAGLPLDKVTLHSLISGGSFGRRANPWADYVVEAVHVAKAIGGRAPVRVQSTRESDMRAGLYRPQYVHAVKAGIDAQGAIVGWKHCIVGQSIMAASSPAAKGGNNVDRTSTEGVWPTAYAIPNMSVDLHSPVLPVRPLWWRSVGHTHTAYVMETMLDELATAAGRDPVDYRLQLLKDKPREAAVLKLAAERAGWGSPLAPGRARGVAVHESFQSCVAEVAEVSLTANGKPRVHRVVVAVDCGTVINPDVVRAQMEGGVGFALSAALHSEITIERGQAVQSNFDDYPMLRIDEMPQVEVHLVPSQEAPTGVGEPGVPPLAPAVANALFQLTGQRVRRLPFARHSLRAKT